MKKVVVLMATYNGERYLEEQIDSILGQTHRDLRLYIRDDGSSDGTLDILDGYKLRTNVNVIMGEHLGYPACFWELIKLNIDADYYFFSDQDDVWFDNKVSSAIEYMEKNSKDEPTSYYSAYYLCDSNKNIISKELPNGGKCLSDVLFDRAGFEFTMMFNKKGYDGLLENMPISPVRGPWMGWYFAGCGSILADEQAYAIYRRHENTVTADMSAVGVLKWRITKFIRGKGLTEYKAAIKDIRCVFYDKLNDNDKKLVDLFADNRYFRNVLRKVFYPSRFRRNVMDEILLRVLFLIDKL